MSRWCCCWYPSWAHVCRSWGISGRGESAPSRGRLTRPRGSAWGGGGYKGGGGTGTEAGAGRVGARVLWARSLCGRPRLDPLKKPQKCVTLLHSALILKRKADEAGAWWRALLVTSLSICLPAFCPFETTLDSSSSSLPSTASPPRDPSVSSPHAQLCRRGWRLPVLKRDSHLPRAKCPPLRRHALTHLILHTPDLPSTAQI